MKGKITVSRIGAVLFAVIGAAILFSILSALNNLDSSRGEESRRMLEDSLRRTAAACFAADGCYPPTVSYMQEHYGIRIDYDRYDVFYDCFAQNLMPEITVLEK